MTEMKDYHKSTKLGKIEIAPEVIQTIAALAAIEVKGVLGLSGGGVVKDITQWLGRKNAKQGVRVHIDEGLSLEVSLVIEYGHFIPDIGKSVQEKIKNAIEMMTGLHVETVRVKINHVQFPKPEKEESSETKKPK
ncbi:Asp23/Gls24 family envelope stress response protein [Mechercharimyces sp. CAU 1602]|uniref:Asp23/Gls24 family envelope stress response protein n=1 Tax=Mechercharimyces sp. CAU 1602 TaxID=2973933 RepID=UPI002162AF32|nr:Asp23/Gls24 family envelope stress response protein [Mechercharimyces sp. CAU 1602]MCS1350781.1 Asp23/Gls24 family envelope stress response protein [Mechercharimyces sp. CAU 1602]